MTVMTRFGQRAAILAVAASLWSGCASLPPDQIQVNVDQLVSDYYAIRPTDAVGPQITMESARGVQESFVNILADRSGAKVGYKVGLVTQSAQKKYVSLQLRPRSVEMLNDHQSRCPSPSPRGTQNRFSLP